MPDRSVHSTRCIKTTSVTKHGQSWFQKFSPSFLIPSALPFHPFLPFSLLFLFSLFIIFHTHLPVSLLPFSLAHFTNSSHLLALFFFFFRPTRGLALHLSGVAKSSTSFGWGKGGNVSSAGCQVTLHDPIRHVSSRSGEAVLLSTTKSRYLL